ncbi:MAG: ApaG domain [Opitutales bacterium]
MENPPVELAGLKVKLDRLVYHFGGLSLPEGSPHAFVYFLSLRNDAAKAVTFLGRKWVLEDNDGERVVVEGEKIVGETPRLEPGEVFSYNSYHVAAGNVRAQGSFHGVDDEGNPVFVRIPPFEMKIPDTYY